MVRHVRLGAAVTVVLVVVAAAVVLAGSRGGLILEIRGAGTPPEAPKPRPNIILVLTDDLDVRSTAYMPRLKALLADQGTTFGNFFVTLSLCCPSRASILRGQYAHNHQVLTNTLPEGGFQKFRTQGHEKSTVATWLQAAGYRTVFLGKYLNGYPADQPTYVPPGWDEWYGGLEGRAYSNYNYQLNENGQVVSYGSDPQDYLTDVLARKATDSIRRAVAEARPFFLYLATYAPHEPSTPAPRHLSAFSGVGAPRPPSFNEQDTSDKPLEVRRRPKLTDEAIAGVDELYRKRLQSLLAVDELIASLVDTLEATGTLPNTYVFFTSDNGFHLGEHRLPPGKYPAHEEDIRVPLLVRGPGVPAGQVVDSLALNTDLAPTFAELADAPVPDFVDGRSLALLWRKGGPPAGDWREAVLIERWMATRGDILRPHSSALHTRDYLYVEWHTGERELYHLPTDPYQLQSLHEAAPLSLLGPLASWLQELRSCAAEACRSIESATSYLP